MCGIVAYIGSRPADFAAMKLMSIINKERGKDAIGIFKNGIVYKRLTETMTWEKKEGDPLWFFTNCYIPQQTKRSYTNATFIHNRSASKGAKDKSNIHPFEYVVDGVRWVFMHNGTIDNTTELCKEYDLKEEDFTSDTHLMGYLISHGYEECLMKYIGAAVFVWWRSDKKDSIFVWKGFSKCSTSIAEEERPLFYYQTPTGIYFSSLKEGIQCSLDITITKENDPIKELPTNTVFEVEKNILTAVKIYDRSDVKKVYSYYETNQADMYEQRYAHHGQAGFYNKNNHHPVVAKVDTKQKRVKNSGTWEPNPQQWCPNAMYYWKGKYYFNGHPATGKFRIDINGYRDMLGTDYFYYKGLWLKDEETLNIFETKKYDTQVGTVITYNDVSSLTRFMHKNYVWFQWTDRNKLMIAIDNILHLYNTMYRVPFLSHFKYTFDLTTNEYTYEKLERVNNKKKNKYKNIDVTNFKDLISYDSDSVLSYEEEQEAEKLNKIFMEAISKITNDIRDLFVETENMSYFDDEFIADPKIKEAKELLRALHTIIINPTIVKEVIRYAPF